MVRNIFLQIIFSACLEGDHQSVHDSKRRTANQLMWLPAVNVSRNPRFLRDSFTGHFYVAAPPPSNWHSRMWEQVGIEYYLQYGSSVTIEETLSKKFFVDFRNSKDFTTYISCVIPQRMCSVISTSQKTFPGDCERDWLSPSHAAGRWSIPLKLVVFVDLCPSRNAIVPRHVRRLTGCGMNDKSRMRYNANSSDGPASRGARGHSTPSYHDDKTYTALLS
ncbi:hypothetical protein J6590_019982 [Homalodisca vitripennis]|nr:hypothetical protein J6590_019982 [Homalodisca vitripennis]